jgi:hypothetical protein
MASSPQNQCHSIITGHITLTALRSQPLLAGQVIALFIIP